MTSVSSGSASKATGKGLPHFGGGRRGDLYLRIKVEVPEKLTREERALYEKLRAVGAQKPKGRSGG